MEKDINQEIERLMRENVVRVKYLTRKYHKNMEDDLKQYLRIALWKQLSAGEEVNFSHAIVDAERSVRVRPSKKGEHMILPLRGEYGEIFSEVIPLNELLEGEPPNSDEKYIETEKMELFEDLKDEFSESLTLLERHLFERVVLKGSEKALNDLVDKKTRFVALQVRSWRLKGKFSQKRFKKHGYI